MAMEAQRTHWIPLTMREWADDDGPGEYVDGYRTDEEMPTFLHEVIVMWLGSLLSADGRYLVALAAGEGQHDAPGCEGLRLDLDALWARADALPGE
jgi:hypothetical protein